MGFYIFILCTIISALCIYLGMKYGNPHLLYAGLAIVAGYAIISVFKESKK